MIKNHYLRGIIDSLHASEMKCLLHLCPCHHLPHPRPFKMLLRLSDTLFFMSLTQCEHHLTNSVLPDNIIIVHHMTQMHVFPLIPYCILLLLAKMNLHLPIHHIGSLYHLGLGKT